MLSAQDSKCKICLTQLDYGRNGLQVDHDHVTGKVRGLLCASCNLALGGFKDDPKLLKAATEYLEE